MSKDYKDLIGKKVTVEGAVFNLNKSLPPTEFECLNARPGTAKIYDLDAMKEKGGTFQLLLKNDSMKRAQWSRPFPNRISEKES